MRMPAGAQPDSDHQRRRRRKPQRARAGDHEHCRRSHQRGGPLARDKAVRDEGQHGDRQHRRNEPRGHAVGKPLHRRLRSLRRGYLPDDRREQRRRADGRCRAAQRARFVDRTGEHRIARPFRDGVTLAGQHRLVQRRFPGEHASVHRDAVAGANDEDIAHAHRRQRDFARFAVALAQHRRRLQPQKIADRMCRAGTRSPLEQLAEQHERDHDGGGLEIDMLAGEFEQPDRDAVEKRGARPERDQHVHVGGPAAQGFPRTRVEARARPELDRDGERELKAGRKLDRMRAHRHRRHLRHEWNRQERSDDEHAKLAAIALRLSGGLLARLTEGVDRRRRVVARLAHGFDQRFGRRLAAVELDMRALGREVDFGSNAVDAVQYLLDPCRACGTGHSGQLQVEGFRVHFPQLDPKVTDYKVRAPVPAERRLSAVQGSPVSGASRRTGRRRKPQYRRPLAPRRDACTSAAWPSHRGVRRLLRDARRMLRRCVPGP